VIKNLYAALVEISLFGPIAVYTPYSSISSNAYPLPPPTTLVGALAYAYKRSLGDFKELAEDGSSPALELVENGMVLYASAGIERPYTVSHSIEKVYQQIYLRTQHWRNIKMAYTIGARAITIFDRLWLFYILSREDVARYGYGITRLGRKESLVSVERVFVTPIEKVVVKSSTCETGFYFPLNIASDYSPKDLWMEIDLPVLRKENFLKKGDVVEKYVLPKPFTFRKATVELNENGVVLRISIEDNKVFEIPVPRKVIES